MNRRDMIKIAPMAACAAAVSTAAFSAPQETPVAIAYREWAAFAAAVHGAPREMPDKLFDAMCDKRHDMERAMFAIPAVTINDTMLKLLAYTDHANDFTSDGDNTPEKILREGMALMGVTA
ncbi:hypothetical protein QCN27_13260 [Cereibacter sp. SYSU M97828]|nr:hypothetical protein [Cereibacter flavus]